MSSVWEENTKLRSDLEKPKKQENSEAYVKVNKENVIEIKRGYIEWKKTPEIHGIYFKQIIEAQKQHKVESLTKKVIKIIKEKDNFVRDTLDNKKGVVFYRLKKSVASKTYQRKG